MPQPASAVTEAPLPADDDLRIGWDQPTEDIVKLICAAAPRPGAFTFFGEREVTIMGATPAPLTSDVRAVNVGEAVRVDSGVVVRTGTGALHIRRVRLGDGSYRVGSAIHDLFA